MITPRRIIIVGPSGSGKTTVAEAIARELKLPVVSMDDFRVRSHRGRSIPFVDHDGQKIRTYEDPMFWDGHAIGCKLRALVQAGSGFVAEGNHLLYYPEVRAIADTELYYLDVPFKVSVERRQTRHRHSPADESFALIGEHETQRWVAPQLAARGIIRLDGTASTYVTGSSIIHQDFHGATLPVLTK